MKAITPSRRDPRYIQLMLLGSYVTYAFAAPSYTRSITQFAVTVAVCLLLDSAILLFIKKLPLVPLSGLITSFGTFLLVNSPFVWPYALVASISILSKHILRTNNSHIFNPNNFGLVMGLLFFPHDISVEVANWGGHLWLAGLMFCFGMYVIYRARRLPVTTCFLIGFLALAFFRSNLNDLPFLTVASPVLGGSFQLFIFHMLSDPKTTPESKHYQMAFGFALAVTDCTFRLFEQKYALFYSLVLLCAFYSSFPHLLGNRGKRHQWNAKA